ncbi:MAG TPA: NADH-quinone oxidoreductase subunit K [Burkholderiaceae bacterium]|nr:NADH-quinone oxidoreductase subunit K [Burkholderiaceae bacterium]
MNLLVHAVVVWLFLIGVYGIVTSRNMIHMAGCIAVAKSATAVLLLAIGFRDDAAAPIRQATELARGLRDVVDPVVQALMLVDVVVSAAITALLLALAVQYHRRAGSMEPRPFDAPRRDNPGAPGLSR